MIMDKNFYFFLFAAKSFFCTKKNWVAVCFFFLALLLWEKDIPATGLVDDYLPPKTWGKKGKKNASAQKKLITENKVQKNAQPFSNGHLLKKLEQIPAQNQEILNAPFLFKLLPNDLENKTTPSSYAFNAQQGSSPTNSKNIENYSLWSYSRKANAQTENTTSFFTEEDMVNELKKAMNVKYVVQFDRFSLDFRSNFGAYAVNQLNFINSNSPNSLGSKFRVERKDLMFQFGLNFKL